MDNFKAHFDDFALGRQLLLFIQNPFLVTNVTEFSGEAKQTFRWVNVASLQMVLIELQENVALKEQVGDCDPVTFWGKMVPAAGFAVLNKMAPHILTMFGSTYCCESALSTMNITKTTYRTRLTIEHLHQCLRIALTPFLPKFKVLAGEKKCKKKFF
ncbi:UNVERIFIED_CONTAM: hypothetical protein FKN15_071735 [Acipenser sinensis]